ATIVLTGAAGDRPMAEIVKAALPRDHVRDGVGHVDLLTPGRIIERMDLLVPGDTGPMHVAGAVGTPVVAIFGPSDPARYAPRGPLDHVVGVDTACGPGNRLRR